MGAFGRLSAAKFDLLRLDVRLVQAMAGLFEKLSCGHMFLSSAVEETFKSNGEAIRDFATEANLRTRLRYIYKWVPRHCMSCACLLTPAPWASLETANFPEYGADALHFKVWGAPSIHTVRRIADVTVETDDELLAFDETGDEIRITLREDASPQQPKVAFELTHYFAEKAKVCLDLRDLAMLFMSTSVDELPSIAERLDVRVPEEEGEEDDDDGDGSDSESTSCGRSLEQSSQSDGEDGTISHESTDRLSNCNEERRALSADKALDSRHSSLSISSYGGQGRLLRELIPSHQRRSETVIQRAKNFRLADSLVVEPPFVEQPLEPYERASRIFGARGLVIGSNFAPTSLFSWPASQSLGSSTSDGKSTGVFTPPSESSSHGDSSRGKIAINDLQEASGTPRSQSTPSLNSKALRVSEIRLVELNFLGGLFVSLLAAFSFRC